MTPTIEQAIEIIRQLPPPDREKFFVWAEEEKSKELAEKKAQSIELKVKNSNSLCNGLKKIKKNLMGNG